MLKQPFTFSQSSLHDFDTCRRLFWLRWVEGLEWPAAPSSRADEMMLTVRQRFHRLLHQHFIGVDVSEVIAREPADSLLRAWWEAFQRYPPALPADRHYPEITLYAPVGNHLLAARYDLLAVEEGRRAVIVDWKTGRQPPNVEELRRSWQTCVYQYLLAEAGAPYYGGSAPQPEAIEMIYWYAEYAASPVWLGYSHDQHQAHARRLAETIRLIASLPASDFVACDDASTCARCGYQSYCGRGAGGIGLPEDEDIEEDVWDVSDVPEYEY